VQHYSFSCSWVETLVSRSLKSSTPRLYNGQVRKIAREWVDVHRPERKEVTEAQLPQAGTPGGTEPDSYALQLRTGNWIDLNADAGEGFDDAGLLQHVTSVNISCGGHVGSTESIARTVHLAAECGAAVGAHVSFVDSENFGRVRLDTPAQELRDQVLWQASALNGLCQGAGTDVRYIKPHGALYHAVMEGGEQAEAVFEAAQLLQLPLLLMPQSSKANFGEGFAERAYDVRLLSDAMPHSAPPLLGRCWAAANCSSLCRPSLGWVGLGCTRHS
jgi:UPF0271 protein